MHFVRFREGVPTMVPQEELRSMPYLPAAQAAALKAADEGDVRELTAAEAARETLLDIVTTTSNVVCCCCAHRCLLAVACGAAEFV